MKTLELLAVTDSLVETKETSGRYRLPRRNPLPKFGSAKNPFTAAADQKQPELPPVAKTADPIAQPAKQPVVLVATAKTELPHETAKTRRRFPVDWVGGLRKVVRGCQQWFATLVKAPRRWFGRGRTGADVFRRDRAAVQCELSLDNVKVVRNDLRDSDLEVVPLRSATIRKESPGETVAPADAEASSTWDRLSTRLHPPAHSAVR